MLKEANDPTRQANQRARTDDDGPPLLAVDERLVIPQGKVVKFIVTADDVIHSFAMPAFWIKQDANPRPAPRDLGQGRPAGRLFRPMLGAVRRPPRLHADRDRGRPAGAVRAVGRVRRAAICRAPSRPRDPPPRPLRPAATPAAAQPTADRQQPARDQPGRDRAELSQESSVHEHHRRLPASQAARGA